MSESITCRPGKTGLKVGTSLNHQTGALILFDSQESEVNEESSIVEEKENACMSCGRETELMEYCSNVGCDIYLCSQCYIYLPSGEIICEGCSGNCFCCDQIINLSDIEINTDITCHNCFNEGTYCEKCTETYHLFSCNLGVCHVCTEKCIGCEKVVCCNKTFHTTERCEMCVLSQLSESREYMIRDILSHKFCNDETDIISDYCE
ncbi:MAG: hypothetical protein PHG66_04730 [Candidatus Colwellbacteria bacterium]|nr:hypothetical protein [Candidatus Colwellbacteria bacterium]